MRTFGGVVLGVLLFFPGITLLRWLSVNVFGAYSALTLTDGCLVMIMILLCVNLVRGTNPVGAKAPARARRPVRTSRANEDFFGDAQPSLTSQDTPTDEAPRRRREPTGRRRTTTTRRDRER